jgi:hypothetical protein
MKRRDAQTRAEQPKRRGVKGEHVGYQSQGGPDSVERCLATNGKSLISARSYTGPPALCIPE